jgi:hypothetical protein
MGFFTLYEALSLHALAGFHIRVAAAACGTRLSIELRLMLHEPGRGRACQWASGFAFGRAWAGAHWQPTEIPGPLPVGTWAGCGRPGRTGPRVQRQPGRNPGPWKPRGSLRRLRGIVALGGVGAARHLPAGLPRRRRPGDAPRAQPGDRPWQP